MKGLILILLPFYISLSDACQIISCPCFFQIDANNTQLTQYSTDAYCTPTYKCDAKAKLYYVGVDLPNGVKGKIQLTTNTAGLLEYNIGKDFGFVCNQTAAAWSITSFPTGYAYTQSDGQIFTPTAGMIATSLYCL